MEYDLIVIGAGPGGYEAAFEAADLGMRTALIEKESLGGTCLNRGCIPTKALLYVAELYRSMQGAEKLGITVGEGIRYDMERMQCYKQKVISQLQNGIENIVKQKKVDLIYGIATVSGEGCVLVCNEEGERKLTTKRILLATGSRPVKPPITGADLPGVVTSGELLENKESIDSLVIIGGGVIGVEFASLYEALGTKVTVIEAMPQLLPRMDRELAQSLKMLMRKRGVDIITDASVEDIRQGNNGKLICEFTTERLDGTVEADKVLICVGRRPCTDDLFADGVQPNMDRGRILVNERYETSLSNVYAIGDVTGGIMLAHSAIAEGRNAVRIMAGCSETADIRWIPSCIYTEPEIAWVGMTVEEARKTGINADSRKVLMGTNGKTTIIGGERGYIRVIFEKESGIILGAQMMCERATDMISEFSQAITARLTMQDMARVIRPHPTFSEAISDAVREAYTENSL